jgi:hypothetical protein
VAVPSTKVTRVHSDLDMIATISAAVVLPKVLLGSLVPASVLFMLGGGLAGCPMLKPLTRWNEYIYVMGLYDEDFGVVCGIGKWGVWLLG